MEPFCLKSVRGNFQLLLGLPQGRGQQSQFTAELTGPLSARVDVYEPNPENIARFFVDMARDWTGWRGHRDWESLERHLRFSASTDRTGHIYLATVLRDPFAQADWLVQATLVLEAGQLDSVARAACRVFDPRDEIA